ncbi:hypothetical protein BKA63DRAFT_527017 [Paraphoma chrysanthemicola]|nr:hypothetical protein BKA63DRAFT_527017 [Paraphoma chrysanthemicola]
MAHASLLNLRIVQVCAFVLSRDLNAMDPATSAQPSTPQRRYTLFMPGRALLYAVDYNLAQSIFWDPKQIQEVLPEDEIPGVNGYYWTRVETLDWPFLTMPGKICKWLELRGDDLDT